MTTAVDIGATLFVQAELIGDNPYQPRASMDQIELAELADDIERNGLHQRPLGRQVGDSFQLAFGHRRVAAIRLLIDSGRWNGDQVPVIARDLTDDQMAFFALSENTQRADLDNVELLHAYSRALTMPEINRSISKLAKRLGVDRSTLSTNLSILELPVGVLDRISEGVLSLRAAREFKALVGGDHRHTDEIEAVLDRLGEGADWRVESVRQEIRFVTLYPYWAPLVPTRERQPLFDVETFKKAHPGTLHQLPEREGRAGETWTCNGAEWIKAQNKAYLEQEPAEIKTAPAPDDGEPAPETMPAPATNGRRFVYDGRNFGDPDPALSVEDVTRLMSRFFPYVATGTIVTEDEDGVEVHRFGMATPASAIRHYDTDSATDSVLCGWGNRFGADLLHDQCPGHVMDARTGREFDCSCKCHPRRNAL